MTRDIIRHRPLIRTAAEIPNVTPIVHGRLFRRIDRRLWICCQLDFVRIVQIPGFRGPNGVWGL